MHRFGLRFLLGLFVGVWGLASANDVTATPPLVAVFDPVQGTQEARFSIDLDYLDRVSGWMRAGGVEVQRLTV
ncbi:MAG: hypothetical protein AAF797_06425 [Planctomycetota bacterium]